MKATAEFEHGTVNGYTNRKCRCTECRAAWSAYHTGWRQRQTPANAQHGTITAYTGYRCRCDECRAVWREYSLGWREARKARERAA